MKQQPSIRQALDKKSSQVAMKITIPLFFVITLLLVSLQIQQKSKIVSGKIDIDRGGDVIAKSSHGKSTYSPVRKTERPIHGAIHAILATGYMITLGEALLSQRGLESGATRFLNQELLEMRTQLRDGLSTISKKDVTDIGAILLSEVSAI